MLFRPPYIVGKFRGVKIRYFRGQANLDEHFPQKPSRNACKEANEITPRKLPAVQWDLILTASCLSLTCMTDATAIYCQWSVSI